MKRYQLTFFESNKDLLYYPTSFLPTQQVQHVSYGSIVTNATCLPHPDEMETISLSTSLKEKLMLSQKQELHLYIENGMIKLGPLIGVFTAGFTGSLLRPIGERSLFFSKMLSIEKNVGVSSYVFGAHGINWEKGSIEGLYYDHEGWHIEEFPFPDVIYDRLPNRKTENHKGLQTIKERIQREYLIPWYNPGFFNKWDIYKELVNINETKPFLPDTRLGATLETIEEFIKKYRHVYIKPANGSLGLGIYQLLYSEKEQTLYCRFRDDEGENRLKRFKTLETLYRHVLSKKPLEHYVVQQGIRLLRYQGTPVDFRVHSNKNQDGKWEVSVIAGKGAVTTHLNNGGQILLLEDLFPDEQECEKVRMAIEKAALLISQTIEGVVEGYVGEIGFDFGLDQDGQIWLFEANSKPGRSIFSHPKLVHFDQITHRLSFSYALYLVKQQLALANQDVNV